MGYTQDYNRNAAGKAWKILGWTYDGRVFCPNCADSRFISDRLAGLAVDYEIENPAPLFASDEIPRAWACDDCDAIIDPSGTSCDHASRIAAGGVRYSFTR